MSVRRPTPGPERPRGDRLRRRFLPGTVLLAALLALQAFAFEVVMIRSESMAPLLRTGDRVLVLTLGHRPVARGDVVVFDGSTTFGAVDDHGALYVKRVVAVGGDEVACCTDGKVTVNGAVVEEPYVHPGDAASDQPFHPEPLGRDRLWLMGDHRSASKDSRSHLAANGGGTVAATDVIGPVVFRLWPLDRFGTIDATSGRSDAGVDRDALATGRT